MTSIEEMMKHAGSTRLIQKYGRLYVMQLARWLSESAVLPLLSPNSSPENV
jgi:hypothetical protein